MDIAQFTTRSVEEIAKQFKVNPSTGLSTEQVAAARAEHGENKLAEQRLSGLTIFIRQFKSSFVYLLIGAAILALVLGETIDGVMIFVFVFVNAILGFLQEFRSEKTSQLLKQYTVQHTTVKRNGQEQHLPSVEVVPGDVLLLEAGDIVPADCRLVEVNDCMANETVLTGESVPIAKHVEVMQKPTSEIYEANNLLFSGTTLVSGEAVVIVVATGTHTTMGEVATLTTETHRVSTFEIEINKFSKFILRLVLITLVCVLAMHLLLKAESSWVELIIFAIALAVGVIPEGLPVVTTFSLSRGALRLAKQKVVVKRLTAIEDLGGIEVLCTDKTGTITENKLTVADVSGQREQTIWQAALAGAEVVHDQSQTANNSFDLALWQALTDTDRNKLGQAKRLAEIPFDPDRRRNSVLMEIDGQRTLIVRGAAEVICGFCPAMGQAQCNDLAAWVAKQGEQGRRAIAVAHKPWNKDTYDANDELSNLEYVGAISFVDPIKASTLQAVSDAKELGVSVKVITGDSKEVAGAVGQQVGLVKNINEVLLGAELEAMSHAEQLAAVNTHHMFARISPKQKYHIIELLQEQNIQVGFLGEGINDAPALKKANISLVVQGASDIAREAADVILLDQSLEVIIDGIREGRSVFANTMKYIQATLSSNFGNFYAVALVSLFIDFLPMLPLQILLLNLLSDFPMVSIAADRVDAAELRRPKNYHVRDILLLATFLGITSTVFDFIFFATFRMLPPSGLQTNWFIGSVLTELAFLFSIRTHRFFTRGIGPAPIILVLTGAAAVLTVAIPYTSLGQRIFQFTAPTGSQLITILGIVAVYLMVTETVKVLYYKHFKR
jgi:Mg2+-importing ATPase